MTRLNTSAAKVAQEDAHARKDYPALASDIPALVGSILRTTPHNSQDYEDLRQEGLLAGLAAVRTWNPEKGAFSTHVLPRVRGAILSYQRANCSIVRTRTTVPPDIELDAPLEGVEGEDEPITGQDALVYGESPHGLGDPGLTLMREMAPEAVERLLVRLGGLEAAILRRLYGVGVSRQSTREIAAELGCSAAKVFNIARQAMTFFEHLQKSGDTVRTRRMNAEPRTGADRRSHVPADRFPGFWNDAVGEGE